MTDTHKTTLLARRSGEFYDEWESLDEAARMEAVMKRLDEHVNFARKNIPFYDERLAGYKRGDIRSFAKIPVLSSADLRKLLPPLSNELLSRRTGGYNVFQSGGTTGEAKTTIFSDEELEALNLPNARGFYAMGLNENDRVANLFAVGGLYMTFIHINRMLQQYGCMNFPFSNHTPPDLVHGMARFFGINCIAGISSVVLKCLRGMTRLGLKGIRIEKLFYGGEHFYDEDREFVRRNFGTDVIGAPGYGTVDSWYLGYQCLSCASGVFHAHDDQCYIEIIDEKTGKTSGPGEAGLIYATPFLRRLTPVFRYKAGDRAMWLGERCKCGRTTPLFRLGGRGDDVLRIGYDSVDYGYVRDAVGRVVGSFDAVQIEKQRIDGRDRLVVRVESEVPPRDYPDISKKLADEIVSSRQSLRKFIADGTVWPVQIELLSPGVILRNSRTGKFIRVIDSIQHG